MANSANILLHGLFFLQYQGNKLVAMTPDHHHHHFLKRPQGLLGDDRHPFPNLNQDESFINLIGSTTNKFPFPPEMLKFDNNATGVGDLVIKAGPKKNYRSRVELPWPLDIIVMLRYPAQLSDFHSNPNSQVGISIYNNSGPSIGLVTLLHYETNAPSFTISLFAEHRNPVTYDKMNPVYIAAQDLFSNGTAFDLQLVSCGCNVPTVCPDDVLPAKAAGWSVLRDDEHSFGEIYDGIDCAAGAGTDIANCVQFGLLR